MGIFPLQTIRRAGKRPVIVAKRAAYGKFSLDVDARAAADRVEVRLPYPPSVNGLYANLDGHGRINTERYDGWLTEAGWRLLEQRPGRIAGPYQIEIHASRPDNRARDLGNLEKPISDLLVKHRVVADDSLADKITIQWEPVDAGAGVRVILTRLSEAGQ